MSEPRLTLHYRMRASKSPEPSPLVLLLHGYGSNEDDLFSIAPLIDPGLSVASVRAPHALGPGAFAWFDIDFTQSAIRMDADEALRSRDRAIGIISELLSSYRVDISQVYLIGFSQGAVIAAAIGLKRPDLIAGIVMMSGAVLAESLMDAAPMAELEGLNMLVVHGRQDPVLPVELARSSKQVLGALPIDLTYCEFDMGHQVTDESLYTVLDWLRIRLDRQAQL
jgi:phospholipase/carboxylesterase